MGWMADLGVGKRLLVELRGLRRAAERIADCLELQAQGAPSKGGQSFRGFSREKVGGDGAGSAVEYVDSREMEVKLAQAEELSALLGRAPTDAELEMAFRGDVEPETRG